MFTEIEIGAIAKMMGKDFSMRIPYGNPILKHKKSNKIIFSFYKRDNGYFIRKRYGYKNPFGGGRILNNGKVFPNMESLIAYFENYKNKYADYLY